MRRSDREIIDINKIEEIIDNCYCCRLGFNDNGNVYIVPLNFGYNKSDKTLYFHSAKEGRKISLIEKVSCVGFEMDTGYRLYGEETACTYTAAFKSIIGNGEIAIVEDVIEKEFGLQSIMRQNTKRDNWTFDENILNSTCVFKVSITDMTCKIHD